MAICLAEPLSLAFTQLLSVGLSEVPDDWKRAVITPVFKKGAVSDGKNWCTLKTVCR